MTVTRTERLMFAKGGDGLGLAGMLFGEPGGRDLVVLTHGAGDRFCEPEYVRIARELVDRGHAFLSTETRGHDIVSRGQADGVQVGIGLAFERFADSVADIGAWVAEGRRLGPRRLVLAGHSLGGAKAVRAMAGTAVAGLLLLAPAVTRLADTERSRLAAELTAAGRGGELMPFHPDAPPWELISAATLHEVDVLIEAAFGGSAASWATIDAPTLVLYGGAEPDKDENIEILRAGWTGRHPLTCEVVDGAGHFFEGYETRVADLVADWMTGLA